MGQLVGIITLAQIAAPEAPSAALISPAAAGNVNDGAHSYKVTFVAGATETEGGAQSDPVTVVDKTVNGRVVLTNILYRTEANADPEIIDYTRLPTALQLPIFGLTIATNIAVEYSNVNAGVEYNLNLGSDNSFIFSGSLRGNVAAGTGGVVWFLPRQLTGAVEGAPIRSASGNVDSSLLDNAIVLAVNNQGAGNFTGGDDANR